mmetsp:Transcript_82537/g.267354  ORF Transcript_82537/g.267354 Transcript_82537/m.267354 type:complete len:226 (-) Transcript_82537:656-1333(-)
MHPEAKNVVLVLRDFALHAGPKSGGEHLCTFERPLVQRPTAPGTRRPDLAAAPSHGPARRPVAWSVARARVRAALARSETAPIQMPSPLPEAPPARGPRGRPRATGTKAAAAVSAAAAASTAAPAAAQAAAPPRWMRQRAEASAAPVAPAPHCPPPRCPPRRCAPAVPQRRPGALLPGRHRRQPGASSRASTPSGGRGPAAYACPRTALAPRRPPADAAWAAAPR